MVAIQPRQATASHDVHGTLTHLAVLRQDISGIAAVESNKKLRSKNGMIGTRLLHTRSCSGSYCGLACCALRATLLGAAHMAGEHRLRIKPQKVVALPALVSPVTKFMVKQSRPEAARSIPPNSGRLMRSRSSTKLKSAVKNTWVDR